jgi:hypothetical protein
VLIASAVTIALWSLCCLRLKNFREASLCTRCVSSPLIALLIMIGNLRLNVHRMTVVTVRQVIWLLEPAQVLFGDLAKLDRPLTEYPMSNGRSSHAGSTAEPDDGL